jgi:hypothetical protein
MYRRIRVSLSCQEQEQQKNEQNNNLLHPSLLGLPPMRSKLHSIRFEVQIFLFLRRRLAMNHLLN